MSDRNAVAPPAQVRGGRLGKRDRAVLAARAPERDGEVMLALDDVAGNDRVEESEPRVHELGRLSVLHDEADHRRVQTGLRPQFGHVVWVGQEAHVHDDVGVGRRTVLEAKRRHGDRQRLCARCREALADHLVELLGAKRRGVQNDVGALAQFRKRVPLGVDAVEQRLPFVAHRVAAARLFEPSQKDVVGRFEEEERDVDCLGVEAVERAD